MPRFFCKNINREINERFHIDAQDSHHITKVLRMQVGNIITVCDTNKTDYECEITSLGENVEVQIISKAVNKTEPNLKITLYQALPKADKLEFIIQKAVELGVTEIVPIQTKFCVAKADEKTFEKKLVRYNKIAFEAAKQCSRGIIPTVSHIISFEQAINNALSESGKDNCICYYEGGGKTTHSIIKPDITNISFFIGSEGGFSETEIELVKKSGINTGTLGKLILRCETAPIVALTLILNATENM